MTASKSPLSAHGGSFLTEVHSDKPVLTPESLPGDVRTMGKSVEDFVRNETKRLRSTNQSVVNGHRLYMREMLSGAAELGLLSVAVPEEYGGIDLPKSQVAFLTEKMAINPSFAISAGVHSGVATLPILYFGTEEQKRIWLPKLATGEAIGAFALSEADSGSDALAAKTRADPSKDTNEYILTGSKMWITNGGFADVFIVFAKVAGSQFTAFIVEANAPGLIIEREEHKMGLNDSSTVRLTFNDVRIPKDAMLGDLGKGHLPALYCLNLGRYSIAATALGMSKEALRLATDFAQHRKQFGKPIAEFGLIARKLAICAVKILSIESMLYRTGGYLDEWFSSDSKSDSDRLDRYRTASQEFAIECALLKFMSTEILAYVVDEALQIHGGYGFSEEFEIARLYRDARVFRIFEGTNEINRLTVVDQILRRVKSGRIDLNNDQSKQATTVRSGSSQMRLGVLGLQQLALIAVGGCVNLDFSEDHQEVMGATAELCGCWFAAQSISLRVAQVTTRNVSMASAFQACIAIYSSECAEKISVVSTTGDAHTKVKGILGDIQKSDTDVVRLHRIISQCVLEAGGYPW